MNVYSAYLLKVIPGLKTDLFAYIQDHPKLSAKILKTIAISKELGSSVIAEMAAKEKLIFP